MSRSRPKPSEGIPQTRIRQALVEGISVPVGTPAGDVLHKAEQQMKRAGISVGSLHFRLFRKSVDARRRTDIRLVYTVLAETEAGHPGFSPEKWVRAGYKPYIRDDLHLPTGQGGRPMAARPLVVGMGPAGLFSAYLLARQGYAPILIDRGDSVRDRVRSVERFTRHGILDGESNIQFGAGGAGTFSDGKLLTRINDPRCAYVLETLVEMGAPADILLQAKPHVGTDILRNVVETMLSAIESLGGTLRYRCRLDGFRRLPDGTFAAETNQGEIPCGVIVLAPGHSARDTYRRLIQRCMTIEAKPISVGVRIEHTRAYIDRLFYGDMAGHPDLGAAEYHLSDTKGARGVYTFCMCPGGEVVAAASEPETVVVNGMSVHARDGRNSNAAIAVSVHPTDLAPVEGNLALGAIAFQQTIERAAFVAGGSDYSVPLCTVGDFLDGCDGARGHMPTTVLPTYRGGDRFRLARMQDVLPPFVCTSLAYGLRSFDRKAVGFALPEAILSAPETRTSAPVRILRGEDLCALGEEGIYPCGEGAGYAGGITSAAVDGLRVAEAILEAYAPPQAASTI